MTLASNELATPSTVSESPLTVWPSAGEVSDDVGRGSSGRWRRSAARPSAGPGPCRRRRGSRPGPARAPGRARPGRCRRPAAAPASPRPWSSPTGRSRGCPAEPDGDRAVVGPHLGRGDSGRPQAAVVGVVGGAAQGRVDGERDRLAAVGVGEELAVEARAAQACRPRSRRRRPPPAPSGGSLADGCGGRAAPRSGSPPPLPAWSARPGPGRHRRPGRLPPAAAMAVITAAVAMTAPPTA